ncbi:MAG: magnesium protoporphyrin IX methyltransferase [Alphaproteobacteria bacterium]|nr:magnesium protoporphyrin IX methyltransferase [Alphaproteobacteria bacterium]
MSAAPHNASLTGPYEARRSKLEAYFDRTALDAWTQLTSDAPVSRIRETVRAGRDQMRATLLSWLPQTLNSAAVLDAGCGTGALSVEASRRGARVTGVDVSASLIDIARKRAPDALGPDTLSFHVGDMLDARFGAFDHAVAMDSLIHYPRYEILRALSALAQRTRSSILFTFAPRTPALALMHAAGKFFPRGDRAPAIEPVGEGDMRRQIAATPALAGWSIGRSARIVSGFYVSHAMELTRG